MTFFSKRLLLSAALSLGLLSPAWADDVKMPDTMIWTAYDLGSSGYVEASAIADAMIKKYGTQVRILPSGTSVGRLLPLKGGKAQFGWLANEVYFASERNVSTQMGHEACRFRQPWPVSFEVG